MSSRENNCGSQVNENHGVINNTFNLTPSRDLPGPGDLPRAANRGSFGLCLGQAPQIEADAFIGRKDELEQMRAILQPADKTREQRILSIVGMGGMGKTQLALAFARAHTRAYSSIFWLDAQDKSRVMQSLSNANSIVHPAGTQDSGTKQSDVSINADSMRRWLSEPSNDDWLLLFDNYDDPDLPGLRSTTGYDIRQYFPMTSQGTIIITTRSPKLAFSKQLKLQKLPDIETSLSILSHRAGRDLAIDDGSRALAERLDGFPLALATAGTCIGQTTCSCTRYLQTYETAWSDLYGEDAEELYDYENRSLATTWDISVKQVRAANPDAAELLMFLAYFGHKEIDYELFCMDRTGKLPWLGRVTKSKMAYERTMSKLRDYSLVEVSQRSYHLHPCLHDWLVCHINDPPDHLSFQAALSCVTHAAWHSELGVVKMWANKLGSIHFNHLTSKRFAECWAHGMHLDVLLAAQVFGLRRHVWCLYQEALPMYNFALTGYLKIIQSGGQTGFAALLHLTTLYQDLWMLDTAGRILKRAAAALKKAFGENHPVLRLCIRRLAVLYLISDSSKTRRLIERFRDQAEGNENHFASVLNRVIMTMTSEVADNISALVNIRRLGNTPWLQWRGPQFIIQAKVAESCDQVEAVNVDELLKQAQSDSEDVLAPNDILKPAILGDVIFTLDKA